MRDDAGLDWSRSRVIVAARAAGLPPPPQSVHPDIRDLDGLAASCAHGRALGFLGRAAIHPRQLPVIERAYLPTEEEIEQAETIIKAAATDQGAQALPDGRFVDAAVVAAAQRTLSLARRALNTPRAPGDLPGALGPRTAGGQVFFADPASSLALSSAAVLRRRAGVSSARPSSASASPSHRSSSAFSPRVGVTAGGLSTGLARRLPGPGRFFDDSTR